ncbi:hypothetical protein NHX12_005606 [Muraenolepis orangiensis]|uniref:Uncharacterized protein n=1 Tax=Muraenolepis orangiensis TaxID=630683 RepID=A0A9Q0DRR4_9TELE|nr:hypothetical protein NHX12_005606 [Muraenolepis orangiensis]
MEISLFKQHFVSIQAPGLHMAVVNAQLPLTLGRMGGEYRSRLSVTNVQPFTQAPPDPSPPPHSPPPLPTPHDFSLCNATPLSLPEVGRGSHSWTSCDTAWGPPNLSRLSQTDEEPWSDFSPSQSASSLGLAGCFEILMVF